MLVGWRLAAPEFARTVEDMLSGEAARLYGGRWNSPGRAAVYLGDSLALAGMELLVHLGNADVLETYRKMPVYIPEELTMNIEPSELPPGWETGPRGRSLNDRGSLADRRAIRCPASSKRGDLGREQLHRQSQPPGVRRDNGRSHLGLSLRSETRLTETRAGVCGAWSTFQQRLRPDHDDVVPIVAAVRIHQACGEEGVAPGKA